MISVIMCSRDERRFRSAVAMYAGALAGTPFEVVRVANAASLADGYNRGLRHSRGDIIVFSHDDVEVLAPDFAARLANHVSRFDVVGVAGTTRLVHPKWFAAGHPFIFGQVAYPSADSSRYTVAVFGVPSPVVGQIQALDGLLLAVRRPVLDRVKFDERVFDGFHLYDLDFSLRAYREGFSLCVANDLHVLHQSGGNYGEAWGKYARRFVKKHGLDVRDWREARPRWHRWAVVEVFNRRQLVRAMTPAHWLAAPTRTPFDASGRKITAPFFAPESTPVLVG